MPVGILAGMGPRLGHPHLAGANQDMKDWFVGRIEEVLESDPVGYVFGEWEVGPGGAPQEKDAGRRNDSDTPAYPADGTSTFAVDDFALIRFGLGQGGRGWEILKLGAAARWCADPGTRRWWWYGGAAPDAEATWERPAELGGGTVQATARFGLANIMASSGGAPGSYQGGNLFALPLFVNTTTGAWRNVLCIPPNSGEWVVRWGARAGVEASDYYTGKKGATGTGWANYQVYAQVVAVDAAGEPTLVVSGDGITENAWSNWWLPVVAGQAMHRPGGTGADPDTVFLGDVGAVVNGGHAAAGYPVQWDRATGTQEFRWNAGAETLRLAIRYQVAWWYGRVPDDPTGGGDWRVMTVDVLGHGVGNTFLTATPVTTSGCVACDGSGSGSGSGACCDVGDMSVTFPADTPNTNGETAATFTNNDTNSWKWSPPGDGTLLWRITCASGVYALTDPGGRVVANGEEVDCEAFGLSFDLAGLGETYTGTATAAEAP